MLSRFWKWYEKYYKFNLFISTLLFLIQLFHLYWMTTYIVAIRLIGQSFFAFPTQFSWIYALVDYTEIPALLSVSLIYVNQIRTRKEVNKSWLYLVFLNVQWLHLFWITDEVVATAFVGSAPVSIPNWLAWVAILIDFLEIPVMLETTQKALVVLQKYWFKKP